MKIYFSRYTDDTGELATIRHLKNLQEEASGSASELLFNLQN